LVRARAKTGDDLGVSPGPVRGATRHHGLRSVIFGLAGDRFVASLTQGMTEQAQGMTEQGER
jgi:hypothetical protein